jgi:hypothetical protein
MRNAGQEPGGVGRSVHGTVVLFPVSTAEIKRSLEKTGVDGAIADGSARTALACYGSGLGGPRRTALADPTIHFAIC